MRTAHRTISLHAPSYVACFMQDLSMNRPIKSDAGTIHEPTVKTGFSSLKRTRGAPLRGTCPGFSAGRGRRGRHVGDEWYAQQVLKACGYMIRVGKRLTEACSLIYLPPAVPLWGTGPRLWRSSVSGLESSRAERVLRMLSPYSGIGSNQTGGVSRGYPSLRVMIVVVESRSERGAPFLAIRCDAGAHASAVCVLLLPPPRRF